MKSREKGLPDQGSVSASTSLAYSLIYAFQSALADSIPAEKSNRQEAASDFIAALASAGAVDQLLMASIGLPAAASLEIFLTLLAKRLAPDPELLRRLDLKLDVVIEEPLRTGLDVFEIALGLSATSIQERKYRDSRLRDAQGSFDRAWGMVKGRRAHKLVGENDWLEFRIRFGLLRTVCAATCLGGYQEAVRRSHDPLGALKQYEDECERLAASHRAAWTSKLEELENKKGAFTPEFIAQAQGKKKMQEITASKFELSIEEVIAVEAPRILSKLHDEADRHRRVAELYERSSRDYRHASAVVRGLLKSLCRSNRARSKKVS